MQGKQAAAETTGVVSNARRVRQRREAQPGMYVHANVAAAPTHYVCHGGPCLSDGAENRGQGSVSPRKQTSCIAEKQRTNAHNVQQCT